MRQATVYIDSTALQYNLSRVKQLAPNSKIVSMVKANAYGHGVKDCLAALNATDAFGVATLEEALELRTQGSNHPITLIEGIFNPDEMLAVLRHQLECVVHHQQQVEWLLKYKDEYIQQGLKVWIKLNSGMNRLGFKIDEIIDVITSLKNEGFHCVLAMHFANADVPEHPMNQQQIQQLLHIKQTCAPIEVSCCNSAAIFNWPELHFDYVRPGIMLYGASPFADKNVYALDLKPVMTFTARIIALNHIQAGDSVGYGSLFTADKAMKIAIVSIGYGDGYPRAYIKQNYVAIDGKLTNVIGRVSMDMIAIDVTDFDVSLDSEIELWGQHRLVDDVADANGTIGYELLCRLSNRPIRRKIEV
ncbi:alanine racemase [Acinetobacter sp. S40]|uniref:alanine racemase n=1 Tax=unclassified Acinetobacter TaxID=196816 RepID=UPI001909F3E2|nr:MULTISPECIES: alanine racemase [unclassified Acinetobacter]MBJ9985057.1 alanine racemase [Acinetobacter sp. S40]MBK0062952.1 alanine racemase [Acinetobacter sp. S55]MBK0066630.1 alanine racemase [Acinetobacter sp. S54]